MISVRSEVQVFPGPPRFAVGYAWRSHAITKRSVPGIAQRATTGAVSGNGAIAQLGERVLCKHEVVGSIPSGSTSLRWLRQLRLGKPIVAKAAASKLEERRRAVEAKTPIIVRETSLRMRCPPGRSMRVF